MGMFDYVRCKYPLPVPGHGERLFQTKDAQENAYMEVFEIREDGTLWQEEYDIEDRSDFALGKGPDKFCGCMSRVNQRWKQIKDFHGDICFYESIRAENDPHRNRPDGWVEFKARFTNGKVQSIDLVELKEPGPSKFASDNEPASVQP